MGSGGTVDFRHQPPLTNSNSNTAHFFATFENKKFMNSSPSQPDRVSQLKTHVSNEDMEHMRRSKELLQHLMVTNQDAVSKSRKSKGGEGSG